MKNSFSVWSRLQSAVIQAWGRHSCLPSFKQAGWNACPTLGRLILGATLKAAPPVVSNIAAAQRSGTKLVDIYYDLSDADGDAQLIQVQISADGGLTYTIPCVTLKR